MTLSSCFCAIRELSQAAAVEALRKGNTALALSYLRLQVALDARALEAGERQLEINRQIALSRAND